MLGTFASTSPFAAGVTHRLTNPRAHIEEVANARNYADLPYRSSTIVGRKMGREIGALFAKWTAP